MTFQTPQEKLIKRLEENNLVLKANVSIDHPNQETSKALLHFVQLSGVKLNPIIEVTVAPPKPEPSEPEVVSEPLPE